ncbi:DUF1211 domain-containing protein [Roseiconus nitratireducens]|uniref:DUF1211 domain-containing protein n=1 Tax=Roseiconus nitratireducens TaxID=2605748 RepID=A0A5M6D8N7_9BACT|nr:TMEM175 family protein [Roseiconus nitratireducens]KAA5542682.1 DUF1211 domain-containing protein [Roseiconus nitratireducens]
MFKPERVGAFCDGVIAVSITILVLGIQVPSSTKVPEKELLAFLNESLLPIHGYVTSFFLIGTYWVQHFAIFHYINRVDKFFIALNGVFLLCVTFVSFPTGLQVTYRNDELAMILYALTQAMCGLSLMAIWSYATRGHRLIGEQVTEEVIASMQKRIFYTPLVSLLAIALSFVNLNAARIIFLAIPLSCFTHRVVDDGWSEPDHRSND